MNASLRISYKCYKLSLEFKFSVLGSKRASDSLLLYVEVYRSSEVLCSIGVYIDKRDIVLTMSFQNILDYSYFNLISLNFKYDTSGVWFVSIDT
jgi:hypothetical protein